MDDAQPAKRPSRRRQQTTNVAVLYNVDFEDTSAALDPGFEARAGVRAMASHVAEGLSADGAHNVVLVRMNGDFAELRQRLEAAAPDCVFNLCESLGGDARLETAVPTMLDLMGIPYTGSDADALSASLYKDRVKSRLTRAGIPTPKGVLVSDPDHHYDLPFPCIVKPSREDGSAGIWSRSVVYDKASCRERVAELLAAFKAPCLVEQYIEGREFNVAILGYPQARVLPLQEIDFSNMPQGHPRIVSYEAKWRTGSPEDLGTEPVIYPDLPAGPAARLRRTAAEAFRALGLRDYGRVDLRLGSNGIPYVIDVNPNCDLSPGAGFARASHAVGIEYAALVRLLIRYALRRKKGTANAREPQSATSGQAR